MNTSQTDSSTINASTKSSVNTDGLTCPHSNTNLLTNQSTLLHTWHLSILALPHRRDDFIAQPISLTHHSFCQPASPTHSRLLYSRSLAILYRQCTPTFPHPNHEHCPVYCLNLTLSWLITFAPYISIMCWRISTTKMLFAIKNEYHSQRVVFNTLPLLHNNHNSAITIQMVLFYTYASWLSAYIIIEQNKHPHTQPVFWYMGFNVQFLFDWFWFFIIASNYKLDGFITQNMFL